MSWCFFILLLSQVPATDLQAARQAVGSQDYGRAVQLLDEFLESDDTHIEGRYLRGIALRERGRNPTLKNRLQRVLARSAADFEFVVARDSAYQDVLFQYAILKRYEDDLEGAIRLGEAQLEHRPDLDYVLPRLLSFYWRYVVTTAPQKARLWLRSQSGSLAPLFIGRAYERQGMYDSAETIYADDEDISETPLLLAQARLSFARMRPEIGTETIEEAISGIDSKVDALVFFEEIKTIASPAEVAAFERIEELEEYRKFFRTFWTSRDPMPAAAYNARMVEHYRRLRIAEQNFLFNGYRSWFRSAFTHDETYFPVTYELSSDFNDRGIVFMRHGEPDDYTVGEANSWLYNDSLLVFHFAPTCIGQVCGVTEHFVPSPLGPTFEPAVVGLDALDAERKSVDYLVNGLSTDRHQWSSDTRHWEVPYVVGAFRGLDGRTLVEVYYKVPLHETARVRGPDSVVVETGFAIHTSNWERINYVRKQSQFGRGEDAFVDRFQVDLSADRFNIALHARVLDGVHLRAYRFDYTVPRYTETGLQLSDMLFADSIAVLPDAVERDDVILYVNPSGQFERPTAPFVYFEVYNLTQEPDGQTRYRIAYTLTPVDAGQEGTITLQTSEQRSANTSPLSYVALDLGEASAGSYTIEVEVEDLITGVVARTGRALHLK